MKLVVILVAVLFSTNLYALEVGRSGNTYPITEISFVLLIQQKIEKMDMAAFETKIKKEVEDKAINFRPSNSVSKLGKSKTQKMFAVGMEHTLSQDIVTATGTVLYPKGYTFNVLSVLRSKGIQYPFKLVIIDGNDEEELLWYNANFGQDKSYRLLITDGLASSVVNKMNLPTFYATKDIIDKFEIKYTPSIIFQPSGKDYMAVLETPAMKKRDSSDDAGFTNETVKTESSTEVNLDNIIIPDDFYEKKKQQDLNDAPTENAVKSKELIK